jgi:pimeloyl-ACP methyl ester carboxylesterase
VTPTLVAHARDDRLVPFTEAKRLCAALPPGIVQQCTVMGLFGHSGKPPEELGRIGIARETLRFVGVLRGILGLI